MMTEVDQEQERDQSKHQYYWPGVVQKAFGAGVLFSGCACEFLSHYTKWESTMNQTMFAVGAGSLIISGYLSEGVHYLRQIASRNGSPNVSDLENRVSN